MGFKYLDALYAKPDQWQDWQVGDEYLFEEGRASGDRSAVKEGLFKELEARIDRAEAAKKAAAAPQASSATNVAGLVKFFSELKLRPSQQAKLDADVLLFRSFLASQRLWTSGTEVTDPKNRPPVTVAYDNQFDQQEFTRVEIVGGKLMMAKNKNPLEAKKALDTAKMASFHSGLGCCVYVMSQQRNLHVHSHVIGAYHHSSLLGGAPVFGAGEMQVENGVIRLLTNKSGHYEPARESLYCVLSMLQHEQVELEFAITEYRPKNVIKKYPKVIDFMKDNRMDDDGGKELTEAMERLQKAMLRVAPAEGPKYTDAYAPF